ncbi:hypothetical protein N431DRAFT_452787 [Stipitochalara longipes BDJ]|nr:hypothetical protein N431DRAFT_452787 [Stipitochalara longipes BDJ]
MSISSGSGASIPDTPSSSSVQKSTPTQSEDARFTVALSDQDCREVPENSDMLSYDTSVSYLSFDLEENSSGNRVADAELPSVSASSSTFDQARAPIRTTLFRGLSPRLLPSVRKVPNLPRALSSGDLASQLTVASSSHASRVDEWLDNQPSQDYNAISSAVATPITPAVSDAGDFDEGGCNLFYDGDAESESSSATGVSKEESSAPQVALDREGLGGDAIISAELGAAQSNFRGEKDQTSALEEFLLLSSTVEEGLAVIKVNTPENVTLEEGSQVR